jgi:hypothetical protein
MQEKVTIKMDKCLHCVLWDAIRVYRNEVPYKDREVIVAIIMVLGDFIAGDHDLSQVCVRNQIIEVLDKHIALRNSQKKQHVGYEH